MKEFSLLIFHFHLEMSVNSTKNAQAVFIQICLFFIQCSSEQTQLFHNDLIFFLCQVRCQQNINHQLLFYPESWQKV